MHALSRSSATAPLRRGYALCLQASIAVGRDHPLVHPGGETRAVLPALESPGVASTDEVEADALAVRLRDEAVAHKSAQQQAARS